MLGPGGIAWPYAAANSEGSFYSSNSYPTMDTRRRTLSPRAERNPTCSGPYLKVRVCFGNNRFQHPRLSWNPNVDWCGFAVVVLSHGQGRRTQARPRSGERRLGSRKLPSDTANQVSRVRHSPNCDSNSNPFLRSSAEADG
jgi:hypothetical protein